MNQLCTTAPANCRRGDPTGSTFKLAGNIETYVAEPKDGSARKDTAILFITDVIGLWQNSKLMTDQFAANGYYTLLPDLFNGDPFGVNSTTVPIMEWLQHGTEGNNPHTVKEVDPIVEKAIKYLREEKGFKKIGAVGYCFVSLKLVKGSGTVLTFYRAANMFAVSWQRAKVSTPAMWRIRRGYTIPSSYLMLTSFSRSFVDDEEVANITGPLSISAAQTDTIFTTELRHKSEEILIETKLPFQINLFSGVAHGFAVRGDVKVPIQKFAREQAFLQAVTWFNEHLS